MYTYAYLDFKIRGNGLVIAHRDLRMTGIRSLFDSGERRGHVKDTVRPCWLASSQG